MDAATVEEVMEDYRRRPLPQLIPRDLEIRLPKVRKCFTIIGPRRAGKTYFLYQQMGLMAAQGARDRAVYVNLDDERLFPPRPEDLDTILRVFRGPFAPPPREPQGAGEGKEGDLGG